MAKNLWGEFDDKKFDEVEKIVYVSSKYSKLEQSKGLKRLKSIVKIRNPFITQTIEVKKQAEMLRSLIDTYSTKSGPSNFLLQPCQIIPEVDFPAENAVDFVCDIKFNKPTFVIPTLDSQFARGIPRHYSYLNTEICKMSIRKAASGQLSVAGFTDAADSALILFSDAIEVFVTNLMEYVREVHMNSLQSETQPYITVTSLGEAYSIMNNTSLMHLYNYWRSLLGQNHFEIIEYKSVFQDYHQLMKQSRILQKSKLGEGAFVNILEMPKADEKASTISPN